MAFELITVCTFGMKDKTKADKFKTPDSTPYEADGFDFKHFDNDDNLAQILLENRPHIVMTFGDAKAYPNIWQASIDVRKRWLHFDNEDAVKPEAVAYQIMDTFLSNATKNRFPNMPLVSVFTPTYKTGDKINRPLNSLLKQTYKNWEWVLYDDSPDDGKTFNEMVELTKKDPRICAYRSQGPCGIIGEVKRRACGLAKGDILVELDHDDALTEQGLYSIVAAFQKYPDAGFAYTDCAEVFDDGRNSMYPPGWGFGFGSYRFEWYNGKQYAVTNFPDINAKTIRHIVASPNHIRAWRKKTYMDIGGHNPDIHVCDDYELCVRTFLKTRMIHVQKLGYIQYYNVSSSGNTQRVRNKEIQRLVKYFRHRYHQEIHDRFVELGVDDFIWKDGQLRFDIANPATTPIANYLFNPDTEPVTR